MPMASKVMALGADDDLKDLIGDLETVGTQAQVGSGRRLWVWTGPEG